MGIYLPNMEMPTEEYGTMTIKIYPNGHVAEYIGDMGRVWDAVPVPPHGRLIDADELAQQYVTAQEQREKDKTDYCNAFMNNGELCTEWWCVEDMLENAPTIIPADPAEEGGT